MVKEFRKKSNTIEWDFVLGFFAILVLWLLVGHELLYNYANGAPLIGELKDGDASKPHPIVAFGIFVVIYASMFFLLGASFHKGFLTLILGICGYLVIDIWSPPIMIKSGLIFENPLLITLGVICLIGSIIFFIIANRLELPARLYIFAGFILLGIMLLTIGINLKLSTDPFKITSCEGITMPPQTYCMQPNGDVMIPGNLAISTDSFFYLIFRNILSIPHFISWFLTYLFMPTSMVILFAVFMTRKQMGKAVVDGWSQ